MTRVTALVVALALGCGPRIEVESDLVPDPPVERCEQGMVGRTCARPDGIGVCLSFDACELPCETVADCPPPWQECLLVSCDYLTEVERTLCRYSPACG